MSEEEQEEEKVHTIDDVLDAALEAGFTNVNDLRAFTRIARGDEPYRHDIIKAVGCDYQAASQIVKRLNKMGLVEEFKEERTKLRLLKLTRGGLELEARMLYGTEYVPEAGAGQDEEESE